MINSVAVDLDDPIVLSLKEDSIDAWTSLLAGIDSASNLSSEIKNLSAIEYENFGRKMSDLASEYSRSLSYLASGAGNSLERHAFAEASSSIRNAIDNLRAGGADAYTKYGQEVLESIRAARTAQIAGVGGALIDLTDLSFKFLSARVSGDWRDLGKISAQIGTIAAASEVIASFFGTVGAFLGVTGSPVAISTLVVVTLSSLVLTKLEVGDTVFGGISDLVNEFFTQSRDWRYIDPLAIDLDGDGIETVPINASTRVLFDHNGDGIRTGTGWLKGDDAWLVMDRNGNGQIDDGGELFGVDTVLPTGQKASNGFAALAGLDSNHDNVVDAADADYSRVQIWRDLDQDGVSELGELLSIAAAGIDRISLASADGHVQLNGGNVQTAAAFFTRSDGSTGKVANLNLVSNPFFREFSSSLPLGPDTALMPNVRGSGMVRDLREAARLDPDLVRIVNSFAGSSRAEMMVKVDQLVADWAATSGFKTSKLRVEALGMKLICGLPGVTPDEMKALRSVGQTEQSKASILAQLKVSEARYESLRAQEAEMSRMVEILEVFNGQNYLEVSDEWLRSMAASTSNASRSSAPVFIEIGLLWVNRTEPLTQAFVALKESIYDALVLPTRLKDCIDAIKINVSSHGFAFDFNAIDFKFDQSYAIDPFRTFVDCIDLQRVSDNLGRAGWQGAAKLSSWATDLVSKGQVDALNSKLASEFAVSNRGIPKIKAGTNASDVIFADAKQSARDIKQFLLLGLGGNDYLRGDDGGDILDGGVGNDTLNGGAGSDIYMFAFGGGQDVISNYDESPVKLDVIQFAAGISAKDIQLTRRGDDLTLNLVNGSDRVTVSNYFNNDAAGLYKLEEIRFADGTVWTIDFVKTKVQQPTSGNDTLIGYAIADSLRGGDGDDDIRGAAGDDVLYGDAGDDGLDGGAGNDNLSGGEGSDRLSGGRGNDTLDGGACNDTLYGDGGSDVYLFGRGSGQDRVNNIDWDAKKTDVIQLCADIAVNDVQLSRRSDDLVLSLIGTNDSVTVFSYFQNDVASIYKLEEIRFADGTVWTIDFVKTKVQQPTSGNDTLIGYAIADTLYGGGGNDFINGDAGDDLLFGDAGADVLSGSSGADRLNGGENDDSLYGGSGDDTLDGGAGNDYLSGDSGNDVYLFGRGSGQDRLYNIDSGTNKVDAIQLGVDISVGDVQLIRRNDDLVLSLAGTSDAVTIYYYFQSDATSSYKLEEIRFADGTVWNISAVKQMALKGIAGNDVLTGYATADTLSGGDGNDILNGGNGNDLLLGQDGADYLYGDAGNDILRGGTGNDWLNDLTGASLLEGGAGNDSLYASAATDIVIGGSGNDSIHSGAGNDLILFNKGDGLDIRQWSDTGADILSLGGGLRYADLSFSRSGNHLVLQMGATDQITFQDWYATAASRSVARLQMITEPSADYAPGGSDPTSDQKVECFNFSGLVAAFDAARSADPNLTSWSLGNALNSCRLTGSDTSAYGGDIAYQYGLTGSIDLIGSSKIIDLLSDAALGSVMREFAA